MNKCRTETMLDIVNDKSSSGSSSSSSDGGCNDSGKDDRDDQEEALIALVEHRTKEVELLHKRVAYYKDQLQQAEKRLHDSQSKLTRLKRRTSHKSSKDTTASSSKEVKMEHRSITPVKRNEVSLQNQPKTKTPLVISSTNPVYRETSSTSEDKKPQTIGSKRKIEHREHVELVPLVRSQSSPCMIRCNTSTHISSQHKRKLRSLSLCPANGSLFITSSLDGMVNLWQLQARGSGASLLSSTECLSPKQRRWPEDIAWHPEGKALFSAYTADGGENQISIIDLNKTQGRARVRFLEGKPHVKGVVNSIIFMPWDDVVFATGGSDHAVVLWSDNEEENVWKPKTLHRNAHSSAVMGVAGMQHKQMIMSAGADKRIIGFDLRAGRAEYKHQIDSKCMSVLPNPSDFNLFMVQTGAPERQLRLYDIRMRQTELHSFGWKQESSESQSALINQTWSPDGVYITSGSADPMIHIFDIRYNAHRPSQSVQAHQKRVFKAVWHYSIPLLISISSDLSIGLHKINGRNDCCRMHCGCSVQYKAFRGHRQGMDICVTIVGIDRVARSMPLPLQTHLCPFATLLLGLAINVMYEMSLSSAAFLVDQYFLVAVADFLTAANAHTCIFSALNLTCLFLQKYSHRYNNFGLECDFSILFIALSCVL